MSTFREKKRNAKGLQIWPLVGFLYTPIILWVLLINLPKVQWKYVFESNKTKLSRHYEKAKNYGYPGIPHHANSGTSKASDLDTVCKINIIKLIDIKTLIALVNKRGL